MTLPLFRTAPIIAPQQPRLLAAPMQYDSQYQEQYSNALRLYFNQLQNFNQLFTTNTGGSLLQFPNGAFHQDGYTTLTANLTNNSTTPIQVTSTAGFLSAGALMIGNELIKYTGFTSTTFTGITRGAYGSTNVAHTAGVYVSEAQPVPSATTALTVVFTTTDVSNQVAIDPLDQTRVVHNIAGYYNLQFSIQLLSHDNTIDDVTLWFRQNGVDVPFSAGYVTVPSTHGGVAGAAIISWNLVLPINAGDYIQLMMSSRTGNTVAATYAPATAPVRPASPSIILSSTFVSALFPPP
jgi:hypothetical protein